MSKPETNDEYGRRISSDEEYDALFAHQINYPTIEVGNGCQYGVVLSLMIDGKHRAIIIDCKAKEKLIQDLDKMNKEHEKDKKASEIASL